MGARLLHKSYELLNPVIKLVLRDQPRPNTLKASADSNIETEFVLGDDVAK